MEASLAAAPDDVGLLLRRAMLLDALGNTAAARDAYIEVLRREPANRDALNNLGTLLFNARYRRAARLTYEELLKHHPDDVMGLVNLGNVALDEERTDEARARYEAAIAIDPNFALAHQGLSYALARLGEQTLSEKHRDIGFALAPIVLSPYRGSKAPVTVLLLVSPLAANIATHLFLDDVTFFVVKLFADYYDPELPLPPHDVIFNAIGDAEASPRALAAAARLAVASEARTINPPSEILRTTREAIARRLTGIEGLIVPRVARIEREEIGALDWPVPFLLRSPGFHTGANFERVNDRAELTAVAARLPGEELLAIEFLDARASDGATRKYRVMFIDGVMYPLHLARASHWKVHYFSADLVSDPAASEEEATFLDDAHAALPDRAIRALAAIRDELRLEYFGVDFALDAHGNVLLFEANATMKIVPPLDGQMDTPRGRAARSALDAARKLVLDRVPG